MDGNDIECPEAGCRAKPGYLGTYSAPTPTA